MANKLKKKGGHTPSLFHRKSTAIKPSIPATPYQQKQQTVSQIMPTVFKHNEQEKEILKRELEGPRDTYFRDIESMNSQHMSTSPTSINTSIAMDVKTSNHQSFLPIKMEYPLQNSNLTERDGENNFRSGFNFSTAPTYFPWLTTLSMFPPLPPIDMSTPHAIHQPVRPKPIHANNFAPLRNFLFPDYFAHNLNALSLVRNYNRNSIFPPRPPVTKFPNFGNTLDPIPSSDNLKTDFNIWPFPAKG